MRKEDKEMNHTVTLKMNEKNCQNKVFYLKFRKLYSSYCSLYYSVQKYKSYTKRNSRDYHSLTKSRGTNI